MYQNKIYFSIISSLLVGPEKSFSYTVLINPLTAGSETQQILLFLTPDDFTLQLGAS